MCEYLFVFHSLSESENVMYYCTALSAVFFYRICAFKVFTMMMMMMMMIINLFLPSTLQSTEVLQSQVFRPLTSGSQQRLYAELQHHCQQFATYELFQDKDTIWLMGCFFFSSLSLCLQSPRCGALAWKGCDREKCDISFLSLPVTVMD